MTTPDFSTLLEQAQADTPPKWDHKAGDTLVGVLGDVDNYSSEYGTCTMLIVEAAEGSTEQGEPLKPGHRCAFYASRTVAASKVKKALDRGMKAGDKLVIVAKGESPGKHYFDYGFAFEPNLDDGPEPPEPQIDAFPEGY